MHLNDLNSDKYSRIDIFTEHSQTRHRFLMGFFIPEKSSSTTGLTIISRPSEVKQFIETHDEVYSEYIQADDDNQLQVDAITVDPIDDITAEPGFSLIRCSLPNAEQALWNQDPTSLQTSIPEVIGTPHDPLRYVQTTYRAPAIRMDVPNPHTARQTADPLDASFTRDLLETELLDANAPGAWYPTHQQLVDWAEELQDAFDNVEMCFLGNIHQVNPKQVATATGHYSLDGLAVRTLDDSELPDAVIEWLEHRHSGYWDEDTDSWTVYNEEYPTCQEFDTREGWTRLWWD